MVGPRGPRGLCADLMTLYADADRFAMGDDRFPTLIPEALDFPSGAVQITLQDYFPIYRAANPVSGETVKGTFVGHSEGRTRRTMQKLFVFIAVCVPVYWPCSSCGL
jgi:hypothetical protein